MRREFLTMSNIGHLYKRSIIYWMFPSISAFSNPLCFTMITPWGSACWLHFHINTLINWSFYVSQFLSWDELYLTNHEVDLDRWILLLNARSSAENYNNLFFRIIFILLINLYHCVMCCELNESAEKRGS